MLIQTYFRRWLVRDARRPVPFLHEHPDYLRRARVNHPPVAHDWRASPSRSPGPRPHFLHLAGEETGPAQPHAPHERLARRRETLATTSHAPRHPARAGEVVLHRRVRRGRSPVRRAGPRHAQASSREGGVLRVARARGVRGGARETRGDGVDAVRTRAREAPPPARWRSSPPRPRRCRGGGQGGEEGDHRGERGGQGGGGGEGRGGEGGGGARGEGGGVRDAVAHTHTPRGGERESRRGQSGGERENRPGAAEAAAKVDAERARVSSPPPSIVGTLVFGESFTRAFTADERRRRRRRAPSSRGPSPPRRRSSFPPTLRRPRRCFVFDRRRRRALCLARRTRRRARRISTRSRRRFDSGARRRIGAKPGNTPKSTRERRRWTTRSRTSPRRRDARRRARDLSSEVARFACDSAPEDRIRRRRRGRDDEGVFVSLVLFLAGAVVGSRRWRRRRPRRCSTSREPSRTPRRPSSTPSPRTSRRRTRP